MLMPGIDQIKREERRLLWLGLSRLVTLGVWISVIALIIVFCFTR